MSDQQLWAERGTSPDRVEAALRRLLHESHAADASAVPARVLNLVVIADQDWKGEIVNRLDRVGRYHASRTILCTISDRVDQINARVVLSSQKTAGGVSVLRERVELQLAESHLERINTIIDPLLVAAIPTVLWSPHSRDQAVEALLGLIDVILIDTDDPANFDGPGAALSRASHLRERAYVVDLAWLRTTPWRERLAAAFDDPSRRHELSELSHVAVRHDPGSLVSALLLSGWLASRLGWEPEPLVHSAAGAYRGVARDTVAAALNNGVVHHLGDPGGAARDVQFDFEPVDLRVPGIAGVTVATNYGFSLSLDRAPGGLIARQRRAAPVPAREWRVLGASRGEGGILGEGVRQALLRDPTYGPALASARRFEP